VQNLIVLGIVPGTNIQLTFFGWLAIVLGIITGFIVLKRIVHHFRKQTTLVPTISSEATLTPDTIIFSPTVTE